jgi:hypothetical protein
MRYPLFLLPIFLLAADLPLVDFQSGAQVAVNNAILAQVQGHSISVVDVKKRLDLLLHDHYPQFEQSAEARFQYYSASWKNVLDELINQELILADAEEKEIKLSDGEIREELEKRFGPSVSATLETLNLTFDEAWQTIKNDLIVRRMVWFFAQSKGFEAVTPEKIRKSYRDYVAEHPGYTEYAYRALTLPTDLPNQEAFLASLHVSPESLPSLPPGCSLSQEYRAKSTELADAQKEALASLAPCSYSAPLLQNRRSDQKKVVKIFYLQEKTEHPAPAFEEMAPNLKNQLINEAIALETDSYLNRLRKKYGFQNDPLKGQISELFQPFSLQ